MPVIDKVAVERAFREAGFQRPFTNQDLANAQKYGTGIFRKSVSRIKNPVAASQQNGDLSSQIEREQGLYNQYELQQLQAPGIIREQLSARSPEFSLPKEALMARYGNPGSPLYIANPFVREAVVARAQSGQQAAFSEVSQRAGDILGQRALIQRQKLGGLQGRQEAFAGQQKAEADAKQQAFENQLALARLQVEQQRAAKSGGGNKDRLLTFSEAKQLGVPIGTKISGVIGKQVPTDSTTTNFDNFSKDYQSLNRISVEPGKLQEFYDEYVEAQQNYNLSKDKEGYLKKLRNSAPDIAPLVRVSNIADNPLLQLLQSAQ